MTATNPSQTARAIFHDVFTAKTADGAGVALKVDQFDTLDMQIATSGNTQATIKCQGSKSNSEPTWANAHTSANRWSYKYIVNEDSGGLIQGSTGVTLAGTDIINEYHINTDRIRWINFIISGFVAGSINVTVIGSKRYKNF